MRLLGFAIIVILFAVSVWIATRDDDAPPDQTTVVHVIDQHDDHHRAAPPGTTTTTTPPTTTTVAARARTAPTSRPTPAIVDAATWDSLAGCESGGRWDDQRGRYEGGLHFLNDTWRRAGGLVYAAHAYLATKAQQITIAASWLRRTSWAQWPECSRKLGLR